MEKIELNINEKKNEEVMELYPNTKNPSTLQLIMFSFVNWLISYLLIMAVVILYQFFTGKIRYPEILIDIAIITIIVTTIILYGSATSGTKLIVPGGLVVYNKAFLDDINSARARAFNVAGPSIGYILGIFLYFIYELELFLNY